MPRRAVTVHGVSFARKLSRDSVPRVSQGWSRGRLCLARAQVPDPRGSRFQQRPRGLCRRLHTAMPVSDRPAEGQPCERDSAHAVRASRELCSTQDHSPSSFSHCRTFGLLSVLVTISIEYLSHLNHFAFISFISSDIRLYVLSVSYLFKKILIPVSKAT